MEFPQFWSKKKYLSIPRMATFSSIYAITSLASAFFIEINPESRSHFLEFYFEFWLSFLFISCFLFTLISALICVPFVEDLDLEGRKPLIFSLFSVAIFDVLFYILFALMFSSSIHDVSIWYIGKVALFLLLSALASSIL